MSYVSHPTKGMVICLFIVVERVVEIGSGLQICLPPFLPPSSTPRKKYEDQETCDILVVILYGGSNLL